jgi:hypothetical protein
MSGETIVAFALIGVDAALMAGKRVPLLLPMPYAALITGMGTG